MNIALLYANQHNDGMKQLTPEQAEAIRNIPKPRTRKKVVDDDCERTTLTVKQWIEALSQAKQEN